MDETLSHDWISAYADGELSPEEQARVEEKLRESPAAMRELFEIRALSGLLSEAVDVVVPPDFSTRVMQQAERESLIGKSPVESSGTRHNSARKWLPIVTICSSVACLAFVLFLIAPGMVRNDRPLSTENTVALQTESSAPAEERSSGERSAEKFADAEIAPPDGFGVSETEGLSSLSFSAPELKAMGRGEGSYLQVISPINLKETTEIGDIVRALRMSAGHVAIVELTVVDRQQGIDNLQFILSGLSIKDDPSVPRKKLDERESAEELYTVFVEAAPSQMHAVLTKMQDDMEFATVEVSTTIPADDLEPYFVSNGYAALGVNRARMFYQESLDESKSVEVRGEVPAKPNSTAGSKAEADATPAKNPKPASVAKDSKERAVDAPRNEYDDNETHYRFSRQAIVRLPEKETIEFFEQNRLQRESAPAPDARRAVVADNLKKLAQPEPIPSAPEPADEPATKPAEVAEKLDASPVPAELPLQVLFVLRLENAELPLPAPKPSSR